ncbi:MAG: hypothetical protein ACJA0H_002121, partial [Francisellaceae bacterium]
MPFFLANKNNDKNVNQNIEPPEDFFGVGAGVTTTTTALAITDTVTLFAVDAPLKSVAVNLNIKESVLFGAIKLADNVSALVNIT